MQRLILFRHGEAQVRAASGRDIDRALTPAGQATAARAAKFLAGVGVSPDVVLVSDAVRTQQTWKAMQETFSLSLAEIKHDLYNAPADVLMEAARTRPEHTVMVVAHNPGLQSLALDLLHEMDASTALTARVESRFPPATAAVFSFDGQGRPTLDELMMGPVG
jgi:phosphohistidine phosphatase